jgi:hypothetical protein
MPLPVTLIQPVVYLDTSKFGSGSDAYGQKGTFLASLAAVALVTITSRHPSCHTTNSLVLHRKTRTRASTA